MDLANILMILQLVEKYLYQIVSPIVIFMGLVGSIFNVIVFKQKSLRKSPCTIYFITYNVLNFIYMFASFLSLSLDVGFHIDPSVSNMSCCRLRIYITIVLNILSPFCLILASIDRILVTSPNALTRQKSTFRLAYMSLFGGILFWCLFHTHAIIMAYIFEIAPNVFLCFYSSGSYLVFIGYYFIIKEIIVLILLIILGFLPIRNIHRIHRVRSNTQAILSRSGGIGNTSRSSTSRERQMVVMLLFDIIIYASCSFFFAIFLLYQQVTQNYTKTYEHLQIDFYILNFCLFSMGIPLCMSFYTNLLTSTTFRKEIKKSLYCR